MSLETVRTALVLLVAGLAVAPLGAAVAPPPLEPCQLPGLETGGLCATYPVFENRAARSGRTIGLKVVVVRATSGRPTREAITYLAGGPGDSSTRGAGFLAQELAAPRATRDLVLVDFRGTGGSDALMCDELVAEGVQGFLDSFFPTREVAACRARLEKTRDLSRYTTEEAVDDIAEVLTAYGYDAVDLYGGSYGTRAAQVLARRHPALVRAMVLDGVVGLDVRIPLDFARGAQRALDALFVECAGDAACAAAFADPAGDMARVLERLAKEPVSVDLADPATGKIRPIRLTRDGFAQTVRYMLYVPSTAVAVPFEIHAAAGGDFRPIAETAQLYASFMSSGADGFYLSVTCPEDTRLIRTEEVAGATAGTFLGDFRIRQQLAACAAWAPRAPVPAFQAPLVSAIPTLLLSGERDPVTPASDGEAVARQLSRSRHVVVPDGAHSTDGMSGLDCLHGVVDAFIAAGSVDALDTSCVAAMSRPPFVVAARAPEVALAPAQLARLVGRYKSAEAGFEIAITSTEAGLRASISGDQPFVLRALSELEFEPVGLPPGYLLRFESDASGAILALTMIEPGAPPARLARLE